MAKSGTPGPCSSAVPSLAAMCVDTIVAYVSTGGKASTDREWHEGAFAALSQIGETGISHGERALQQLARLGHLTESVMRHTAKRTFTSICMDESPIEIGPALLCLPEVSPGIQSLSLSGCHSIDLPSLCRCISGLPQLKSVDVSRTTTDPVVFEQMAMNCLELQEVDASWCDGFTDECLAALSQSKSIATIRCCGTSLSVEAISSMLGLMKLSGLDISSVELDRTLTLDHLHGARLEEFKCNCTRLVDEDVIQSMLKSAFSPEGGKLRILCIAEASIDLESIVATPSKVDSKLEQLDLSWCDGLDEELASCLLKRCPGLFLFVARKLDMDSATDLVSSLASSCIHLQKLSLARCGCIIDADLFELAKSALSSSLLFLDVSWNDGLTACGISSLVNSCKRLETLNLEGCKGIDESIVEKCSAWPCGTLIYLDLGWVDACTADVARLIQANQPFLEVIDYYRDRHTPIRNADSLALAISEMKKRFD